MVIHCLGGARDLLRPSDAGTRAAAAGIAEQEEVACLMSTKGAWGDFIRRFGRPIHACVDTGHLDSIVMKRSKSGTRVLNW